MTREGDATRRRILAIVAGEPGITLRSLAAKVNLSLSSTWEHVQTLQTQGALSEGRCPNCGRWMMVVDGELVGEH